MADTAEGGELQCGGVDLTYNPCGDSRTLKKTLEVGCDTIPCYIPKYGDVSDVRMKTEIAEADVAELLQLFDSVEAKQYKRPDMNGDLRLGFASDDFAGTKWKNLTGHTVERRHGDGYSRLLSPHQRAVGGVQGLPGPAGRGGSLAGAAGAEEQVAV